MKEYRQKLQELFLRIDKKKAEAFLHAKFIQWKGNDVWKGNNNGRRKEEDKYAKI